MVSGVYSCRFATQTARTESNGFGYVGPIVTYMERNHIQKSLSQSSLFR